MRNEYVTEFQELRDRHEYKGQQWFGHRKRLVEKYGWAVPNDLVLDYISGAFEAITEIGAGEGYWASMLDARGMRVEAFDPETNRTWYDVDDRSLSEVTNYVEDNPVLLVWPPANDSLARDVLDHEPSHVLYVGEPSGGCTGSTEFFDYLNTEYGVVENVSIPSYAGLNDNFYHYVRKT